MDPAVEGGYRADGRGGQYIYVLPEWDMILVTTGGGFEMDEITELLRASFSDFEESLPANPKGFAQLEAAVTAVAQPPARTPVAPLPEVAKLISGKTYVLEPNPAKLQTFAIEFDGSSEATAFSEANGLPLVSFLVGLDSVYRFSSGLDGRPQAFRGTWTDAQTFFLEYDGITNNDHVLFQFHFVGDRVEVSVQETAHVVSAQFLGRLQEP